MPQPLSDAIGEMVRGIPGIHEAYLPQCYVKDIVDPPAQILVLVLDNADDRTVLDAVGQGLSGVLPQGVHLDVWPLSDGHSLLDTIRGTRMQIHCAAVSETKPWWRFW